MFAVACLGLISASGTMRASAQLVMVRMFASVRAPDYALIGDSRVLDCRWLGNLTYNPLALANLAVGGTVTRQIVSQATEASKAAARTVIISAGVNDIVIDNSSVEKIEIDYEVLLRSVGRNQRGVITLVAYTSNPAHTPAIDSLNGRIRMMAEKRGFSVIDLNPMMSAGGVLKPNLTRDGIHFSVAACSIWLQLLTEALEKQKS